jgi:hypothetical protein
VDRMLKSVEHYDRVWLVLSHEGAGKGQTVETLSRSFDQSAQNEYHAIKLYVFERRAIRTKPESR